MFVITYNEHKIDAYVGNEEIIPRLQLVCLSCKLGTRKHIKH